MKTDDLIGELHRNSRLRLGLWLIGLILAGYGLFALDDQRRASQAELEQAREHLAKIQTIARQQDWPNRAEAAAELRQTLEAKLWTATSKGLAQANFQAWLSEQTKQSGLVNTRLAVENTVPVPGRPSLWRVGARLEGDFRQPALDQLLLALAREPRLIQIERLEIRKTTQSRFSLVVSGYFQASADESA